MKKLRILFVSSSFERVGTGARAFFLSKYLAKRGHSISLILTGKNPSFRVNRKIVEGVDIFLLPSFVSFDMTNLALGSLSRVLTSYIQTLLNVIQEIASNYDVVHVFDAMWPQNVGPMLFFKISHLLRVKKGRLFVDWDEWWTKGGLLNYGGLYSLAFPMVQFLEEKMPLYADGVTILNDALRQRALRVGVKSENLFVIPTGADVDSIKPMNFQAARKKLGLPLQSLIYTHVGPLENEPFKLLMKVHELVCKYHPESLFLLIGKIRENQASFIKSTGESKRILYVGYQPDYKFRQFLSASDIFILPLPDTVYDRARCPLRLADYLAAGRPVVATALPEIRKILSKCGLLAKPENAKEFAEKILELTRNQSLRLEMGKRARKLAEEKYSWQILAKHLEDAYFHLCS